MICPVLLCTSCAGFHYHVENRTFSGGDGSAVRAVLSDKGQIKRMGIFLSEGDEITPIDFEIISISIESEKIFHDGLHETQMIDLLAEAQVYNF
jgi:hypothetical protein